MHDVLDSNRINTWTSAALSLQLQLSSLKLTRSTSLSTPSLLPMFSFPSLTILAIAAHTLFAGVGAAVLR